MKLRGYRGRGGKGEITDGRHRGGNLQAIEGGDRRGKGQGTGGGGTTREETEDRKS